MLVVKKNVFFMFEPVLLCVRLIKVQVRLVMNWSKVKEKGCLHIVFYYLHNTFSSKTPSTSSELEKSTTATAI